MDDSKGFVVHESAHQPNHTPQEDSEQYIMVARMFYLNGPSRPALFPYSVAFDDGIACKYCSLINCVLIDAMTKKNATAFWKFKKILM